MLASYALELHALKTEVQSTLARLGVDPVSSDDDLDSSNLLDTRRRPITRWNRRQLTQELAAASKRRRQLERQLQREMENGTQESDQQDHRIRRRTAWQTAVTELQQQRAEILRQIEQDTAVDAERGDSEQVEAVQETEIRQNQVPPSSESVSETQYCIGGVVTLEPLCSSQRGQVTTMSSSRSGVSFQPVAVATAPVTVPTVLDGYPRYRHTPDALNDVFSLQLKFAETMLKLEKSVQMRDQLLHHGTTKRRAGTQIREDAHERRHTGRQLSRRRRAESGSNSDSSLMMYRESHSSESLSSSAYSFSSLDSTPHRGRPIRVRYPNFGVSRATTAETLVPSSSGADNSPGSEATDKAAHESPSTVDETAEDSGEVAVSSGTTGEEIHKTPTTGSSVTTPTTGSDQKSNTSSSKQVRFGEDAYSTPIIARKFNFDGPSMDDDDDEEKEEEAESVLSFLGGSSVSSAELNDASFLRAFQRFRRELNVSRYDSAMQSPPPLARKLFPTQVNGADTAPQSEEDQGNVAGSGNVADHIAAFPARDGLSVAELQERRRQLCLDIQAGSAELVLNFGVTTESHDAVQSKIRLLELRDELKAVDARLSALPRLKAK